MGSCAAHGTRRTASTTKAGSPVGTSRPIGSWDSPSVGADIPATYLGPPPSTVDPSLVGPLQLLTSGELDEEAGTITLPLYRGEMRGDGANVWYILTDTTDAGNAAALGLNHAPKLNYSDTGFGVRNAVLERDGLLVFSRGRVSFAPERRVAPAGDGVGFPPSVAEWIFVTSNGPTGCENPQRQGLNSAILDGREPLNVLGGIPTVATDYSPLWDVNLGEWTPEAVDAGYRARVTGEFQILGLVDGGFITGPGGTEYGSVSTIVNCPIVFRFL